MAGPTKKVNKTFLAFRCPPELEKWLRDKAEKGDGVTLTDAIVWALQLGHDYIEATQETSERIRRLAKSSDLTELGILRRVIERGLPLLEKELKGQKR